MLKDSLKETGRTPVRLMGYNGASERTSHEMVALNLEGVVIGLLSKQVGNEEERDGKKEMEFFHPNTVGLASWLSSVALRLFGAVGFFCSPPQTG